MFCNCRSLLRLLPLLVFGAVACGQGGPPPELPATTHQESGKNTRANVLTAQELALEFKKDPETASKKYEGATLEVNGVVDRVGMLSDKPYLALRTEGGMPAVTCFTRDEEPWAVAVPGQTVRVKGKWPPTAPATPVLVECDFADPGKSLAVNLTAEQLAGEFSANPEATAKKYDKKYLIVAGEVTAKDDPKEPGSATSLYLHGDDQVRITCKVPGSAELRTRTVKVGDRLKVVGQFPPVQADAKGALELNNCLVIKRSR